MFATAHAAPCAEFHRFGVTCKRVPGADGSVTLGADCQLWAASCSRYSSTEPTLQPALLQYLSYLTEDGPDCCCSGTHREERGSLLL
ncbi:uncharacterized protein WM294_005027 isoform 3-T10 [Sarcoramphus papa]